MVDHDKSTVDVEEEEINLLDLLAVVVRRKGIILTLTGAALVFSILISLSLPNTYTATSRFLPPTSEIGPLSGLSILMGVRVANLAGPQFADGANLCVDILKSRLVEDAVIKRFDLAKEYRTETAEETRKALERNVKIQAGKEGLISVSVEDKDPKRAAALANAFVEELDRKGIQLQLFKESSERVYLEKLIDRVGKNIQRSKELLGLVRDVEKTTAGDSRSIVDNEKNARMNAELVSKGIQPDSTGAGQNRMDTRSETLKNQIAVLRKKINAEAPEPDSKYAEEERELKIKQELFELLKKRYELSALTEGKGLTSITVLDEAVVPAQKSKPKRSLIVTLSTVTAFFVGIFLAFVREYSEKMPEEDKARWQEIRNLAWIRRG